MCPEERAGSPTKHMGQPRLCRDTGPPCYLMLQGVSSCRSNRFFEAENYVFQGIHKPRVTGLSPVAATCLTRTYDISPINCLTTLDNFPQPRRASTASGISVKSVDFACSHPPSRVARLPGSPCKKKRACTGRIAAGPHGIRVHDACRIHATESCCVWQKRTSWGLVA